MPFGSLPNPRSLSDCSSFVDRTSGTPSGSNRHGHCACLPPSDYLQGSSWHTFARLTRKSLERVCHRCKYYGPCCRSAISLSTVVVESSSFATGRLRKRPLLQVQGSPRNSKHRSMRTSLTEALCSAAL